METAKRSAKQDSSPGRIRPYLPWVVFFGVSVSTFLFSEQLSVTLGLNALGAPFASGTGEGAGASSPIAPQKAAARRMTTDLIAAVLDDPGRGKGLSALLDRLSGTDASWRPPPAAGEVDEAVRWLQRDARPPVSSIGNIQIEFEDFPALAYTRGGAAAVAADVTRQLDGEEFSRSYDVLASSLNVYDVDLATMQLGFALRIKSDRGWFSTDPPLSLPVALETAPLRSGDPVSFEVPLQPKIQPAIVGTDGLPSKISATAIYQPLDPDRRSGPDADPLNPVLLIATDRMPFVTYSEDISFRSGDATDHVAVGGNEQFSVVIVTATDDLRTTLLARRADDGKAVGIYGMEGTAFAAVVDNWSALRMRFVATTQSTDFRYRIYATSSDKYPALPMLLWLASQETRVLTEDRVPETTRQTRSFLGFVLRALAIDLTAAGDGEGLDPRTRSLIEALSTNLTGDTG